MKEFLEYIIKNMVSQPDKVIVEEKDEEGTSLYFVTVDKEDMGTIIGKEGRNINALRNVAKAKAIRDDVHIKVILNEIDQNQSMA